jgi:hypothetical protein
MMRKWICLAAVTLVGCATQPTPAPSNAVTAQAPVGSTGAGPGTGVTSFDIEKQRLAAAKNLNLKVVTQDGTRLYCRSNYFTGSRISADTRCYTADQLDAMEQATQRDLDVFLNRSEALKPAALPSAK